jgi:hypothetical protein
MQINELTLHQEAYQVEYVSQNGKRFMVIPVAMMTEGVHCGSHGSIFHPAEELSRHPESWNGVPVVIHHPSRDGSYVSARDPEIIGNEEVGRIYYTRWDGKLRAQAWLDEYRIQTAHPEVHEWIKQGKPMDVSTGVFTDDDIVNGTWNGEDYSAIARNHRPDHLALLPGERGACSWSDGCGIRANEKGGDEVVSLENGLDLTVEDNVKMLKALVLTNARGMKSLVSIIQQKLDAMDTDSRIHFLEEVFDDGTFVYRVTMRETPGGESFYRRDYTVNDDESVEFGMEPVPVRKQENFITLKSDEEDVMANKKQPCCEEKVELLVQSKGFEEEDRDWLSGLEESQIDKLIAVNAVAEKAPEVKTVTKEVPAQVNAEQAIKVLKETLSTPEQFMAILPDGMRDQMNHGMRLYQQHRDCLVARVLEAGPEVYSEDELKAMDTGTLEKLVRFAKPKVDYSAFGSAPQPKTNSDIEGLWMPGMEESKA